MFYNISFVQAMDKKEFDEYERRAKKYMALAKACEEGDDKTALGLLHEGVDPNGNDFRGVAGELNEGYMATLIDAPIVSAARSGNYKIVKALLRKGADPNLCCCSCVTSLHEAIIAKHVEIVKLLLENGADPTIEYNMQLTSLELAEKTGNQKIIQLIKKYLSKK